MKAPASDRCRSLLEQLSRYIDDEVTPEQRRSLAAHLRRCPCCQTMADSLRHTIHVCRKAGASRLPADVRSRARARVATLLASAPARRTRT
jgi:anti-sigma factor RsiW